jgi:ribose/xylose/arabinose/galactoside ABC-type transport system permease subunit
MNRAHITSSANRGQWTANATLSRLFLSEYLVLWLSLAYVLALGPFTPGFFTAENAVNVLATLLPLFIVSLGETIVLIAGGIDLSVTAVIALTSVTGGMAMNTSHGWFSGPFATAAGVALMLLLGAGVGLLNGTAITRFQMPPFIVTLTVMMFFSGFAIWLTKSKNISGFPDSFTALGGRIWIAFMITTALAVFTHLMLSRSMFGRWLYAVGQNARAAHISGVPVNGVSTAAYVVSGLCAALASVIYTSQAETGSPVLGQRILLDIIGATVIGGTSLFGGKGKVLWTLFGVLFLKLIDNSLNLLNLSIFSITMVKGAVILFAALMDALRKKFADAD